MNIQRPSLEISFFHVLLSLEVVFRLDGNRWAQDTLLKCERNARGQHGCLKEGPRKRSWWKKLIRAEEKVGKSDAVEGKGQGVTAAIAIGQQIG